MAITAYTLDQAMTIFNNTIGHRTHVLHDRKNDTQAYKEWLETRITELGKIEKPSEGDLQTTERYIHYWMACDVICKENARLQHERQSRLAGLIKDFEGLKNAK